MTELYFFSFLFILIAGMLSHDRSVTNPPVNWDEYTSTTFTFHSNDERWS